MRYSLHGGVTQGSNPLGDLGSQFEKVRCLNAHAIVTQDCDRRAGPMGRLGYTTQRSRTKVRSRAAFSAVAPAKETDPFAELSVQTSVLAGSALRRRRVQGMEQGRSFAYGQDAGAYGNPPQQQPAIQQDPNGVRVRCEAADCEALLEVRCPSSDHSCTEIGKVCTLCESRKQPRHRSWMGTADDQLNNWNGQNRAYCMAMQLPGPSRRDTFCLNSGVKMKYYRGQTVTVPSAEHKPLCFARL